MPTGSNVIMSRYGKHESTSVSLELAKELLGKTVQVTIDRPLGTKHPRHGLCTK